MSCSGSTLRALPWLRTCVLVAVLSVVAPACAPLAGDSTSAAFTVGSKTFTESVVLGEAVTLLARHAGANADHRRQLGGTRILWEGLLAGEIDVYPEYTGTIAEEILAGAAPATEEDMRAQLLQRGILMSRHLGFNNTYVVGMLEDVPYRVCATIPDCASDSATSSWTAATAGRACRPGTGCRSRMCGASITTLPTAASRAAASM